APANEPSETRRLIGPTNKMSEHPQRQRPPAGRISPQKSPRRLRIGGGCGCSLWRLVGRSVDIACDPFGVDVITLARVAGGLEFAVGGIGKARNTATSDIRHGWASVNAAHIGQHAQRRIRAALDVVIRGAATEFAILASGFGFGGGLHATEGRGGFGGICRI